MHVLLGNKIKALGYVALAGVLLFVVTSIAIAPQYVYGAEVAVDTTIETANTATNISSPAIVWLDDNNGYIFYEDSGGGMSMASTTNGGTTWQSGRNVDSVNTTDVVSYGVWWEGWTPGTTTTRYIHIVSIDLGVDDTYYTRYDTLTNTLSTTVLGTTQGAACTDGSDCYVSITMTATGTLYMTARDATDSWLVRCGQYLSCTTAANWFEVPEAYRVGVGNDFGNDLPLLLPIGGTDNLMLISWDESANTIDNHEYSATSSSWTATDISPFISGADDNLFYDSQLIGAAVSTTTGVIGLAFVEDANNYTTADHDVEFWQYASSTGWVQKTDVVTDYSGGITGAKVAYDEVNATWYVLYSARSTISATTTANIFFKTSADDGVTWGAEQGPVNDNADDINGMTINISSSDKIGVTWNYTTAPRADDQYYDLVADITYTPPGGGGGGGGGAPQSEFFFGFLFPVPFLNKARRRSTI